MNSGQIRVLHFMSSGRIGGQERAQFQLFRALNAHPEMEITVAVVRAEGPYLRMVEAAGLPVMRMQIRGGFNLGFRLDLLRSFREFDIHHLHDPSPNIMLYSFLGGGESVRRCLTRRGGLFHYSPMKIKKRLKFRIKKILVRRFDGFAGNSPNAVDSLRTQYGVTRPVRLIPNGIDFDLLQPERDADAVRRELGLTKNHFVIGTASRLVGLKRIDLLLRAFARLDCGESRLLIIGDGVERRNLEKLASQLKLDDRVIFTGTVEQVGEYYPVMDVFVLPSTAAESFGNAVVEAMAMAVPSILMADSGGLTLHLEQEKTGWLVVDEADLARRLEWIRAHPGHAADVARAGAQAVRQRYSLDRMVTNHLEFYRSVMEGRCSHA